LSIPDGKYKYEFGDEGGCDVSGNVTALVLLVLFTLLVALLVHGGIELLLALFVIFVVFVVQLVLFVVGLGTSVVDVDVGAGVGVGVALKVFAVEFCGCWAGADITFLSSDFTVSSLIVTLTLISFFTPDTRELGIGPVTLTLLGAGLLAPGTLIFTTDAFLGGGAMLA